MRRINDGPCPRTVHNLIAQRRQVRKFMPRNTVWRLQRSLQYIPFGRRQPDREVCEVLHVSKLPLCALLVAVAFPQIRT